MLSPWTKKLLKKNDGLQYTYTTFGGKFLLFFLDGNFSLHIGFPYIIIILYFMCRDNNNIKIIMIIIFLLRYVTTAALKDYNDIIYTACVAPPQGRRTGAKETIKQ